MDTNVAIHLRDGDDRITRNVAALDDAILFSIVTRVELEGCIYREGYSRRKLPDRMIAAQAIVQRATLVTMNAGDFTDILGLNLLKW